MLDSNTINILLSDLLTNYFSTTFTYEPDGSGRHRTFDSKEYVILFPASFGLTNPTKKQLEDKIIKWLDKSNIEKGYKYQIDSNGRCEQLHPLSDYLPPEE